MRKMDEAREHSCAEITWRIENFTYSWQEKGEPLTSSKFFVECLDQTSWHLSLFPRGINRTDDLGLYLQRALNDKGNENVLVKLLKMEVLEDGNLPYLTKTIPEHSFPRDGDWGFGSFIFRSSIIKNAKKLYPKNVLTVRFKFWCANSGQPSCNTVVHLRTIIPVEQRSFKWNIDLAAVENERQEKTVPFPSLFGSRDNLQAKLSYVSKDIDDRKLKVSISGNSSKEYSYKCDIQTVQAEDFFLTLRKINALPYESNCSTLITQNQLVENSDKYLSGNILTLKCELSIISHKVTHFNSQSVHYIESEISSQWYPRVKRKRENLYPAKCRCIRGKKHKNHCCLLKSDVLKMYKEACNSDFILQVESQTFPVHVSILCARSAVLKRMFETEMKEKQQKILKVKDLDGNTVKKMLDYMYTDNPGELNIESAVKLYYAADKYELFGLKQMCSEYLMQNMTICNVFEVAILAYQHNDGDLKSSAIQFISENEKEIVLSDEFKIFSKNNAQLAVEVMQFLLERKYGN